MFEKKEQKSSDDFWREYEEKTGEEILKRGLGKYVSGWDEFDKKKLSGIWGLVITTSGGFRFHHFPQNHWLDSLTRFGSKGPAKEKTIFIPNEKIISNEVIKEKKWWRKIFISSIPHLVIRYIDEAGNEKQILFEAEYK
ncbi:MAG: hypothetical protein LBI12_06020 [Treponema sp.]|jgi:hypothetical protein|nr:hypothetical protein [Treponema sp.]